MLVAGLAHAFELPPATGGGRPGMRPASPPPEDVPLILDPDFKPRLTTSQGVELTGVTTNAGSGFVIAGRFDLVGGRPTSGVALLDASGTPHPLINFGSCLEGGVEAVVLQPDGRFVIGGDFRRFGGEPRRGMARIRPDGTLDGAFAPQIAGDGETVVRAIALLPDGRMVIGGTFRTVDGLPRRGIARLLPGGQVDPGFDPGAAAEDSFGVVQTLAVLPDGGVIAGGLFTKFDGWSCRGLVRLNAHGAVDFDFAPALDSSMGWPGVSRLRRLADGSLVIAGRFDRVGGETRSGLARLKATGELDPDFVFTPAWGTTSDQPVADFAVQADGRIVVGGDFESIDDLPRPGLARFRSTGELDPDFDPGDGLQRMDGTVGRASALMLMADGGVLVVGDFDRLGAEERHGVGRVGADGQMDPDFGSTAVRIERVGTVNAILIPRGGGILVGGEFERANDVPSVGLARFNGAGQFDGGFAAGLGADSRVSALAEQADGRLLVAGRFDTVQGETRHNLARLAADGRLDDGFDPGDGPDGELYCVVVQADGAVVVSGDFEMFDNQPASRLARLDSTGGLDLDFNPDLHASVDTPDVYSIVAEAEGRLVIGGYFDAVNRVPRVGLARLQADGATDKGFADTLRIGGDLPLVTSVARDALGRYVLAGTFTSVNGEERGGVARLLANGALDPGFDPGDGATGGDLPVVNALALGSGNELLLAGEFTAFDEAVRWNFALVEANGELDDALKPRGCTDWWMQTLAVEPDGDVLVGGPFTTIDGVPRQGLARFRRLGTAPPRLTIKLEPTGAAITWDGAGRLQSSVSPAGPWIDEAGGASPVHATPAGAARFYRLVR